MHELFYNDDASAPAEKSFNALFTIVESGEVSEIASVLADIEEDIASLMNGAGQTLLHIAAARGNVDILKYLLETANFQVAAKDNEGLTAEQTALQNGYEAAAALLRVKSEWQAKNRDYEFNIDQILNALTPVIQHAKKAQGKDLVLLVGYTGSGKSVLLNYLNGCEYEIKLQSGTGFKQTYLKKGTEIAKVGRGLTSETSYPKIVESEGYAFSDLAGYMESRGVEAQICGATGTEMAKRFAKNIKAMMLVIDHSSFECNRANSFKDSIKLLKRVLGKHFQSALDSVFLIITKAEHKNVTAKGILQVIADILGIDLNQYTETLNTQGEKIRNYKITNPNGLYPLAVKETQLKRKILSSEDYDLLDALLQIVKKQEATGHAIIITDITQPQCRNEIKKVIAAAKPQPTEHFDFMQGEMKQVIFNDILWEVGADLLNKADLKNYYTERLKKLRQSVQHETNRIKNLSDRIATKRMEKQQPTYNKAGLERDLEDVRQQLKLNQVQLDEQDRTVNNLKKSMDNEQHALNALQQQITQKLNDKTPVAHTAYVDEHEVETEERARCRGFLGMRTKWITETVHGRATKHYEKDIGLPISKVDVDITPKTYPVAEIKHAAIRGTKYTAKIEYERSEKFKIIFNFYVPKHCKNITDITQLEGSKAIHHNKLNEHSANLARANNDIKNLYQARERLFANEKAYSDAYNKGHYETAFRDAMCDAAIEQAEKEIAAAMAKQQQLEAEKTELSTKKLRLQCELIYSRALLSAIIVAIETLGLERSNQPDFLPNLKELLAKLMGSGQAKGDSPDKGKQPSNNKNNKYSSNSITTITNDSHLLFRKPMPNNSQKNATCSQDTTTSMENSL